MDLDNHVVQIEGHEVARCGCLGEAILLLGVAVFVFHQKAIRAKNLMWALSKYIFGIAPETKPTASAKKAMLELVGE